MPLSTNHTTRLNHNSTFFGHYFENNAEEYMRAYFLNKSIINPPSDEPYHNNPREDMTGAELQTEGERLIAAINEFKETKDPSVFNQWLSLRSELEKTDPSKLAEYDNLVNHIMKELKMEVADESLNIDDPNNDEYKEVDGRKPLENEGTRFLIAARLVDQYFNRPEILESVTHRGLKIGLFTIADNAPDDGSAVAGAYYHDGSNTLVLDPGFLLSGIIDPNDDSDVLTHEFAHAVDDSQGKVDGVLPNMTDEEKQKFLKGRTELFNNQESSQIREYGFSQKEEFLTVTLEVFRENPQILWQESPSLYLAYASYFKTDPLGVANFAIA